MISCMMTRKGQLRDYENHLSPESWAAVDQTFRSRLGDLEMLAPLRPYVGMSS
jgi:hypothetical protein